MTGADLYKENGLSPSAAPRECIVAYENSSSEKLEVEAPTHTSALRDIDRRLRGRLAQLLGGQSPWAALQAWEDWAFHLSTSPGRQAELAWRWTESLMALSAFAMRGGEPPFKPEPGDRRFRGEGWSKPPFNLLAQMQLAQEDQWRCATSMVRGVAGHHARRTRFMGDFFLNACAPVNFPWSNPDVLASAMGSWGMNFLNGAQLLADDAARLTRGEKLKGMEAWRIGETMALTPGKVVYRNDLMELIQYAPTTRVVHREPILIVPAWIMKYYILDLTPEDSLVRYLVAAGYTVFIISWKNPGRELGQTPFDAYRSEGVVRALETVQTIVPNEMVHGVGYCLGGTALAIAAAAMDRDDDHRFATLTLLAAQTDFEEAGELLMFIDESQLALLEDLMHVSGYLDARSMASAFYALRSQELLFAKLVERYLMGQPTEPKPLDAWLADPTRMPARMHSEYLRQLFMGNHFAQGDYQVENRALALKDIRTPIFALGADRDHIAPWRSVYKIEVYGSAETTFVLTGGGHNSSVVSPPGKRGAYFRTSFSPAGGDYVDPDAWLSQVAQQEGSWWPTWLDWLKARSSPEMVKPPAMGARKAGLPPLCDAPGVYVFET